MAAVPSAQAQALPVEAFAKASPFSMPRLSPGGDYLALSTDFGQGNHAVQVLRLSDMKRMAVLRLPRYESPFQIVWVGDGRLVVAKGRKYGSLEKPLPTGEIIASDFDGQNQRYIYGYEQQNAAAGLDRGFGYIEGVAESNDGRFYMRQLKRDPTSSMLYVVDTQRPTFKLIADINVPQLEFVIDRNGVARYAWGRDEADAHLLYRSDDGRRWQPLPPPQAGSVWTPLSFSADNTHVYGALSRAEGPSQLVLSDLVAAMPKCWSATAFRASAWRSGPATPRCRSRRHRRAAVRSWSTSTRAARRPSCTGRWRACCRSSTSVSSMSAATARWCWCTSPAIATPAAGMC
ncbi:MAG: hypothetical protein AB7D31_10100 [Stenotrophomonas sp.]